MVTNSNDMDALNRAIDGCTFCRTNPAFDNAGLRHIVGAGLTNSPSVMLVLMNPTSRNPTLIDGCGGERVSYAGVPSLWRVLVKSGFLSRPLLDVFKSRSWDNTKSQVLIDYLKDASLYLTELVKCPSRRAETPDSETIRHNLTFMQQEIQLVNPDSIITFGLIPFYTLTGLRLKLGHYYDGLKREENGHFFHLRENMGPPHYKIFPCYFPTGRGNYVRAVEMLNTLRDITARS